MVVSVSVEEREKEILKSPIEDKHAEKKMMSF